MKAKELIQLLKDAGKEKPVFISRDEEGNGYGTINVQSIAIERDRIIIYPWNEHLEYDELLAAEDKNQ